MGHPADFRTFYIFCCRFGTDRTFRPKFCGHLREDVCYAGRSSAKVKMGQKCKSVAPVRTESTFFRKNRKRLVLSVRQQGISEGSQERLWRGHSRTYWSPNMKKSRLPYFRTSYGKITFSQFARKAATGKGSYIKEPEISFSKPIMWPNFSHFDQWV